MIDTGELFAGGPRRDEIPPIDQPRFERASEIDWLHAREPVLVVEARAEARAYPLQIMLWHEIVNDEIAGAPVVVTFCPLCYTGYAFERPVVKGSVTTFGTSGSLYRSNLVMYDRATDSLWVQALGTAVVGPVAGRELERIPASIVAWRDFSSAHPDGLVLSRSTGFNRPYGKNPYPGYDDVGTPPFAYFGIDGRLDATDRILGVEVGHEVTAFPFDSLRRHSHDGIAALNTRVGGEPIVIVWKKGTLSALDRRRIAGSRETGSAVAFIRRVGGRALRFRVQNGRVVDRATRTSWDPFGRAMRGPLKGETLGRANAHDSYWFDWAALHPRTSIWPRDIQRK